MLLSKEIINFSASILHTLAVSKHILLGLLICAAFLSSKSFVKFRCPLLACCTNPLSTFGLSLCHHSLRFFLTYLLKTQIWSVCNFFSSFLTLVSAHTLMQSLLQHNTNVSFQLYFSFSHWPVCYAWVEKKASILLIWAWASALPVAWNSILPHPCSDSYLFIIEVAIQMFPPLKSLLISPIARNHLLFYIMLL